MCFSAEASFAVGAVLVPSGLYCTLAAARKNPACLPVAAIPLLFGLQQISEGLVWLGLHHDDPVLTRAAALAFLFAALAVWPFWIPFSMWFKETHPSRRRVLLGLTLLSTAWLWGFYLPLALGPTSLLTVQVHHHSIAYEYSDLGALRTLPKGLTDVCYVLLVTVPLHLSSDPRERLPTLVIGASAALAVWLYEYAFVSVWCFFAAVLSAYLVWRFRGMPAPVAEPQPAT